METILQLIHSGLSTVGPFVILLGLLIFVHELGHFAVAKWCGVRVLTFSLGFGKKIFQIQKGDTNYCVSLIPLGGYVKMFGDEPGAQIEESEKPFSFTHKSVWQRIAIVLAGPLMNLFFAAFVFIIIAFYGEEVRKPVIGDVEINTEAYRLGFRSGDTIKSIDGVMIKTWEEFQNIISQNHDRQIEFSVEREVGSENLNFPATPRLQPNPNILSMSDFVGTIEGLSSTSRAPVIGIILNSYAEHLGLKTGDVIKSINLEPINYFRDLSTALQKAAGSNIQIEVERPPENKKVTLSGKPFQFTSLEKFGIEFGELYIAKVIENTPAKKIGLKENDRVLAIQNQPIHFWSDVIDSIKSYSGQNELSIQVRRGNEKLNFHVTPEMTTHDNLQGGEEKRFTVGISPWALMAPASTFMYKSASISEGLSRGVSKTWQVTSMTLVSFLRMIQAKISAKHIGGVLSIGQAASESFKIGISHFLMMMGFLSINLFILNLLPIPVLDGGHLLFFTVEAIRGAPLSMRKMEIAQQIGLFLLLSLMVFSLFNDVTRILNSW